MSVVISMHFGDGFPDAFVGVERTWRLSFGAYKFALQVITARYGEAITFKNQCLILSYICYI